MHLLLTFFTLLSAFLTLAHAGRSAKLKPVSFVRTDRRIDTPRLKNSERSARSYDNGLAVDVAFWTAPAAPLVYELQPNSISFNLEKNGHLTPDFSNGLEYPDPFLLTGQAAKRAVRYLYSKELFFGDIPHVRAMLKCQQLRRANGLMDNRLGSLRPESTFYRYKRQRIQQNFI